MAAYSDHWVVILSWLIYFVAIELYQLISSGHEDSEWGESFTKWASSVWNLIDFARIIAMILVLIFSCLEGEE